MSRPVTAWQVRNFTAFAVQPSGETTQLPATLTFTESRRALDEAGVEGWVVYTGQLPAGSLDIIAERDAEGRWIAADPITGQTVELQPTTAA
ncbi:hypothetical protein JNUCC0626_18280 [Lentzea sp. JNUCC 0626]|uniref:hypothetical protein n=1 Tax=Lentzea sp. JNUCC 0626 TaxID=3367513 RepID=UPI00374A7EAF